MTSEPKKIVLAGATGLIGRAVARLCIEQGYALTVFSQDPAYARSAVPGAAEYVGWQIEPARADMPWVRAIEGAYAVINCAGENLYRRRLTARYEDRAQASRVFGTLALVQAMKLAGQTALARRPAVFVNSASQAIYGFGHHPNDAPVTEDAPPGGDTWARQARAWEAEAAGAAALGIRTVLMRTSYVLNADPQGRLAQEVGRHRRGRGFVTTPTTAWLPWIHLEDEARLYLFALTETRAAGPLNCTAPEPVRKLDYARRLSEAATGRPATCVLPGLALRLLSGKAVDPFTYGQRLVPHKALGLGFQFRYPTLETALADLVPQIPAEHP